MTLHIALIQLVNWKMLDIANKLRTVKHGYVINSQMCILSIIPAAVVLLNFNGETNLFKFSFNFIFVSYD